MFRSIWSKTVREYRIAILGWGLGLGLLMAAGIAEAKPNVIKDFASLIELFRFLGDPYAIQTPEGFITFRWMGVFIPLLLSFWPVLAGARLVRGEEERGSMDVLLATPQSRARLLLSKAGALAFALLSIAVLFALGTTAGEAHLEGHADFARALLASLNLALLAFFFGMLALLLSQFTMRSGTASGGASGLLLVALLIDITGRLSNGSWIRYISPFYYYNLNRPLIPSFPGHPWAGVLLAGLSLLCLGASLFLFARRDIGGVALSGERRPANGRAHELQSLRHAERALSTRSVGWHTLSEERGAALGWLLGIGFMTVYCLILALSIQQQFDELVQQTPLLQQLFFDTPTNTNAAMLGTFLFTFLPPLVVVFALVLALRWPSDLENGQLELVLTTPNSRSRILFERYLVSALVVLLAPALSWLILRIVTLLVHLPVDQGRMLAASFNTFPMALITIGLVYALTGRLRHSAITGILTVYLVLAFLEELLEGMIAFPAWVMSLSIFHVYGNPVFIGVNWGNSLGMMVVATLLLLIGLAQFRSADIALG